MDSSGPTSVPQHPQKGQPLFGRLGFIPWQELASAGVPQVQDQPEPPIGDSGFGDLQGELFLVLGQSSFDGT